MFTLNTIDGGVFPASLVLTGGPGSPGAPMGPGGPASPCAPAVPAVPSSPSAPSSPCEVGYSSISRIFVAKLILLTDYL